MDVDSSPLSDTEKTRLSALLEAIHGVDVCVFYQTKDLIHRWAVNLPDALKDRWYIGCRDRDFLSASFSNKMEIIKSQILITGKVQTIETRLEDDTKQNIWYKFSIACHRNEQNQAIGILTTGIDISELHKREHILKLLLREVSHRSKNLLAIIQSITSQTARHNDSIFTFLKKLQGRIQSISHSQDLVTDSNWQGARFRELVLTQASGYLGKECWRFKIIGDDPYLFPGAALHIGLALHELISNSLCYGALSQSDGQIIVSSKTQVDKKNDLRLIISWTETFPRHNTSQCFESARFGCAVLQKIVPVSVNGTANLKITETDLFYELSLPNTYFGS